MSNAVAPNITLNSSSETIHAIWKLTRTLLAAGWRYKASSDTAVKETTGSPELDRWAVQGYVNLTATANTGNAASITTVTNNVATVTGLTGLTASAVGRALTISGAASAGNNGTFRIVSQAGTSATIFNPNAVATDANNGSISWTEKGGGTAASVTSVLNGVATITGLTGMVVPSGGSPGSTGHTLTFTGANSGGNNGTFQIQTVISATSVTILNANAVAGDTNNGSIVWTENDPLSQTYPNSIAGASGIGAWINLQGPTTMKITIGSNVPSGTFVRGEKITQATTGAEGEILGVVTDTAGGQGYLVVQPRLDGNGGGIAGWSNTATITAQNAPAGSGASVTPTGTLAYIREIVLWKGSATTGHLYYQCIDTTTESTTTTTTGRFSTMATLGTATTTICPGGATTGSPLTNGFPTIGTSCIMGTGGSGAATTGPSNWNNSNTTNTTGKMQILAANAFRFADTSADGSFTLAIGTPGTGTTTFNGWGFCRLDDTEEGDVEPYVWFMPPASSTYARTRATAGTSNNQGDLWRSAVMSPTNYSCYIGWRRRGYQSTTLGTNGDAYQEYEGFSLAYFAASALPAMANGADPEKVACAFTNIRVREPITIASRNAYQKQRKGTCRWWFYVQGGGGTDTYDGKRWIQLSSGGAADPPVIAGPYDQTTTPANS